MDDVVLGEVRRNRNQVIRVVGYEYEERPYIRLETWDKAKGDEGEGVFSGKRFSLPPVVWMELMPLIEAAVKVAEGRPRPQRNQPRRREPDWAAEFDVRARNGGSRH